MGLRKGHGFRIGGTTHLLLLSIDPWIVMVQGHWGSQAFLSYWRQCEEILPLFMGFHLQDHASILMTMLAFRLKLLGFNNIQSQLFKGSQSWSPTVHSLHELIDAESHSP